MCYTYLLRTKTLCIISRPYNNFTVCTVYITSSFSLWTSVPYVTVVSEMWMRVWNVKRPALALGGPDNANDWLASMSFCLFDGHYQIIVEQVWQTFSGDVTCFHCRWNVCFRWLMQTMVSVQQALVSWLITRYRNRVPGCCNWVTRIWLLGLGLDTKYLVTYNQKASLVFQNKFCDCKKIIFTKLFCDSNKYFCKQTVTKLFCNGHKRFCRCHIHKSIFAV